MKKTILIILLAFIFLFSCSYVNFANTNSFDNTTLKESTIKMQTLSHEKNLIEPSPTDSAIAILLFPYIDKAIQNYFGEPTQYALYDAKVNSITQVGTNFIYKIIITVPTFHGPHNPPYGLETMTFIIKSGDIVLEEYIHKNV